MTTIKTLAMAALLLALTSCASWEESKQKKHDRETYVNPFYLKYLAPGSELDREIYARIEALRADPQATAMHNELGALLYERRFPKDARYEFERALKVDRRYYPARYNLAILEIAEGNPGRARRLLKDVVDQKPGHAEAQFALGLLYEKSGRHDAAIDRYAKAFTIDRDMTRVTRNPRIVESTLVTATLLSMYETSSGRAAVRFLAAPDGYRAEEAADERKEVPPPAEEPAKVPATPAPGR